MTQKQKVSAAYVKLTWVDRFDAHTGLVNHDLRSRQDLPTTTHIQGFWAPTEEELLTHIGYYCKHYGVLEAESVEAEEYLEQQRLLHEKHSKYLVERKSTEMREDHESNPPISL
jgi:CMP-2-keto-3-deoxyoctulosonic acid synthetase